MNIEAQLKYQGSVMNSAAKGVIRESSTVDKRDKSSMKVDGPAKSGKTAPVGPSVGAGKLKLARNDG